AAILQPLAFGRRRAGRGDLRAPRAAARRRRRGGATRTFLRFDRRELLRPRRGRRVSTHPRARAAGRVLSGLDAQGGLPQGDRHGLELLVDGVFDQLRGGRRAAAAANRAARRPGPTLADDRSAVSPWLRRRGLLGWRAARAAALLRPAQRAGRRGLTTSGG